ncbi:hypothetical protein [cyanobacterium endosymbiont of Rhopalodia gibberula]|uniref:hypothetical protein n=1 Tax=cyanobacterium endosymbiont of Rhopalodia gibberula TaxID=1763363 RepID=UPI0015596E9C|nr:hypothetical protein [cyanobacterium endosymbiont of Rhopalodia gibberula]
MMLTVTGQSWCYTHRLVNAEQDASYMFLPSYLLARGFGSHVCCSCLCSDKTFIHLS